LIKTVFWFLTGLPDDLKTAAKEVAELSSFEEGAAQDNRGDTLVNDFTM